MTSIAEAPGRTSEAQAIDDVIESLRVRFPDVEAQAVSELVHVVHASYIDARIREFIPLLVEREASDMLAEANSSPAWSS